MNEGKWFLAAVAAGSIGWFAGSWSAEARVTETFDRWLRYADLPAGCQQRLDIAVEKMAREDEVRSAAEPQPPY